MKFSHSIAFMLRSAEENLELKSVAVATANDDRTEEHHYNLALSALF